MGQNPADVFQHEPGHRRSDRQMLRSRLPRSADGGQIRAQGPRGMEAQARAQAGRVPASPRPPARGTQERAQPDRHAGDGQSPQGRRRRRPGVDRHHLLHGRRRPQTLRPPGPFRACQQVRHGCARTGGRLRPDHSVEFPDGHSMLENDAGARPRQYGRPEALFVHVDRRRKNHPADG